MIKNSYSEGGEDRIFLGIVERLKWITGEDILNGQTYLDIGSYEPIDCSNTYLLYEQGMSGTLVEPNIHLHEKIKEIRQRDVLINNQIFFIIKYQRWYQTIAGNIELIWLWTVLLKDLEETCLHLLRII